MRVVEKRAMSATHKSFRHRSNRVGGKIKYIFPTSHTTVRTVPYTAVQST